MSTLKNRRDKAIGKMTALYEYSHNLGGKNK